MLYSLRGCSAAERFVRLAVFEMNREDSHHPCAQSMDSEYQLPQKIDMVQSYSASIELNYSNFGHQILF